MPMWSILTRYSRWTAWVTALIGTIGSLYFSLGLGWVPCDLCWYQRICLYPLTVILVIGLWRKSIDLEYYVLPLSLTGAGLALYHYLLQKTTWFAAPVCLSGVSCTVTYLDWFGVITIPLLAFMAFLIISGAVILDGMKAVDG